MSLKTEIPFSTGSLDSTGDFKFVCKDPDGCQSITFMEVDGQPVTLYSFEESGTSREVTLTELEAEEINTWRNNGRRNSYWNWPGWEAIRNRSTSDQ